MQKIVKQSPIEISSGPDDIYVDVIVDALLSNRGIEDKEIFLNPPSVDLAFLQNAQSLFGDSLGVAVSAVKSVIDSNGSIVIHGDYDVDGVSATAILWETIYYELGYTNVIPFIPHRVDHGYGVSVESVDDISRQLSEKGMKPGLIITVDCGITGKDAIEYAKSNGFSVIVTDHHTKPEDDANLPNALAILHSYDLCGAGVSWVFARSLSGDESLVTTGVDLVALATLADIQSVLGFNRSLLIEGLNQLSHTTRSGLRALYQVAEMKSSTVGPYEVGWIIAPRLNATGRLEHAIDALRLLVAKNERQAWELARKLHGLNIKRQALTKKAVEEAMVMVDESWNKISPIVVASDSWHEGIIGLIAGKLVETYNVPAIAIAIDEEGAKGSARSIEGVSIIDLLRRHEDLFVSVGGHAGAAGFSISEANVNVLNEALSSVVVGEEQIDDMIEVECELPINLIGWQLYTQLERFEPHGVGNPRPVFYSKGASIVDYKTVGKTNDHLALTLENNIRGIGFGLADRVGLIEAKGPVDLVYTIDKDDYRGGELVQLKVKEIL